MQYHVETGPSERIHVKASSVPGLVLLAPEYQTDTGDYECPVSYSIAPAAAWALGEALQTVALEVDPKAAGDSGEKGR